MNRGEEQRDQLQQLLRSEIGDRPFSELFGVTLDQRGSVLTGQVLLESLRARGLEAGRDFQAIGALTAAGVPVATSVMEAARESTPAAHVDGFVIDFVYPGIKGPSIAGKSVVLVDAWLSEKSYIQTSSLVTLHEGNELDVDCSVISRLGARTVAIASLVGGTGSLSGKDGQTLRVASPVDGSEQDVSFIYSYHVSDVSHSTQDSHHDVRSGAHA
jgi:orotate phosphoribosyltransferase